MKFVLIITGYNCQKYVQANIESVLNQTYKNFMAIFISDGSTDNTPVFLNQIKDERAVINIFNVNEGAALRRFNAIHKYSTDNEDVIVLVDMDDRLELNALERIKKEYDNGAWVTYGNIRQPNGTVIPIQRYPTEVFKDRSFRKHKWFCQQPRTFKKFLANGIQPADIKYATGVYMKNCTDLAIMLPILEQCPSDRMHIIDDVIYIYNATLNSTLKRFGKGHKSFAREWLKKIPPKNLYDSSRRSVNAVKA